MPRAKTRSAVPLRLGALVVVLTFLGLGIVWSFASPHGSSADDDFHLTSAWCSQGFSEYCKDAGDGGVFVPRIIAYPACFVGFPAQVSAACTTELTYEPIYTTRLAARGVIQPFPFHWTMGLFAGKDVVTSVQAMRAFNVLLAGVLLGLTLLAVQPKIRRALVLAWGVGMIPVGVFFIASTNPSSWAITGVGLYWALLLSLLSSQFSLNRVHAARIALLVVAVVITLVSRRDGGVYLFLATVAVVLAVVGQGRLRSARAKVGIGVLAVTSVFAAVMILGRTLYTAVAWRGAAPATDQPNPIIKTLTEIPSFFVGLVGGQRPYVVMSESSFNQLQYGYQPTGLTYGLGWTDFSLPSVVGLSAFAVLVVAFAVGFRRYRLGRVLAVVFLVLSIPLQVVVVRITVGFGPIGLIQPRYIIPILAVVMGMTLYAGRIRSPLLSKVQAAAMMLGVVIAGSFAWLATATRYAIGPESAYTNFGQAVDWWWAAGPSRLVWFVIAVIVTIMWAWATIWNFGARPVKDHVRTRAPVVVND